MVQDADYVPAETKGFYGELEVLRSNAGYYVGTMYNNPEGFQEPGSRDSGYFHTEQEAARELQIIKKGEGVTRDHP